MCITAHGEGGDNVKHGISEGITMNELNSCSL